MWTKDEIKESRNDVSLKAAYVDRNIQQIFGNQFDSVKFINNFANTILAAFVNTNSIRKNFFCLELPQN
jgi:hypothetical protein